MVTKSEIMKFLPGAKPALVNAIVSNWSMAEDNDIINPKRVRQFLSNIAVETAGLTTIVENLNYSSAERIYEVFKGPSKSPRFKSIAECKPLVKNPRALGIKVYGGRMGNAPAPSSDGYDMRGGGMMQTTGREGYRAVGYEDNPSALQTDPVIAFKTACQEWSKRGCNELADKDMVTECRKRINGGTNGLQDVKDYVAKAKTVWPDGSTVVSSPAAAAPSEEDYYSGEVNKTVKSVQQKLDDLGYHEVGTIDGRWGTRTAGSITTFQGDNGLPLDAHITHDLLAALMTGKQRTIAPARANATVAELRKDDVPEIKANDQQKLVGYGITGVGGITAIKQGLDATKDASSTVRDIWDAVSPVYDFLIDKVWILALVAGVFIVYKAGWLQKIRLLKHQTAQDVSE